MKPLFSYAAILILLLVAGPVAAIPSIRLSHASPCQQAGMSLRWYADSSGRLSFSEILQAGCQQHFRVGLEDIGAFGLFDGAVWAHGSFSSATPGKVYLLVAFANIDSLTLYYYDGPQLRTVHAGSRLPRGNNTWNIPGFSFELPSLGDRQQEFWLRVRTGNAVIVPVTLALDEGMPQALSGIYVVELVYLGIVLALFCYNLCLYFWIKDSTYLFYLGYLLFLAVFVLLYLRGFHVMLGPGLSRFFNFYGMSAVAVSYLFAIPFSILFLDSRKHAPRLSAVLLGFTALSVAAILFNMADMRHLTILLQEVQSICIPVLFIVLAVLAYRQNYTPALFFLVAWGCLLGTIVLFTLINMRLLPMKNWYFHILPVGSALEMVLLSLALGYRYAMLKREKIILNDVRLAFIREQNAILEKRVDERTHALKESNRVKDKLLGIISHDLRTPLNNLSGLLELSEKGAMPDGEVRHFSQTVRHNIKYITGTIQNLLNWSLTQMERIETKPRKVALSALAYQVMDTHRFAADQKAILLRKAVSDDIAVKADYHQLELVLRNLVDNAIKFTPQGGIITIGCRPLQGDVEIYVGDTGKGMTPDEASRLLHGSNLYSTEGTDEERGTGLGLQLVKEFVGNNGGVLRIKSHPGKGTEFYFTLPRWE